VTVQLLPPDPEVGAATETTGAAAQARPADFVDCYRAHYIRLVRALRLAGADQAGAEDAAQEAFARALVHWGRVSRGTNPAGYVYTAGFRLLAKAQRKAARQNSLTPPGNLPDPTGSEAASSVAVETALAAMPERRRACAVMCLVVGLPAREAAAALGIADGTVRKHLEEARSQLVAVLR
jgi:RNA polymerase sigma factor (sigma-70 family)